MKARRLYYMAWSAAFVLIAVVFGRSRHLRAIVVLALDRRGTFVRVIASRARAGRSEIWNRLVSLVM